MSTVKIDHKPMVVRLPKQFFGFPPRLQVTLRYSSMGDFTSLSSVAGTFSTYSFRANSIFDPDFSGVGHQPMYRDVYAGIYDQYAVVSSRFKVRFVNQNVGSYWNVGAYVDDDNAVVSSPAQLEEQSSAQVDLVGPLSSSKSVRQFNLRWSCVENLGIDPYSSELYKTAIAANPTEQQYFVVGGNDFGNNTSTIVFNVEIEYDVLFTELQTQALS